MEGVGIMIGVPPLGDLVMAEAVFWDVDIAALKLSDEEKNGLQVFRNYTKAFEKKAAEHFVCESDSNSYNTNVLNGILLLVGAEDIRFLPVIVCSFSDEQLEQMFKREISQGVPGGVSSMLNGFGGLSRFSQRIQIAYAFGWMSRDILEELDRLRKIRNDTSHSWNINALRGKLDTLIDERMQRIEEQLGDGIRLPERFWETLARESLFRIRLIWLVGRCFYEANLFAAAVKRRLNPHLALYGEAKTKLLVEVAAKCVEATKLIIALDPDTAKSGVSASEKL